MTGSGRQRRRRAVVQRGLTARDPLRWWIMDAVSDSDLVDVTISGPDEEWLAEFNRRMVTDRLAACGNIHPEVRSIYRWQGEVEDASEAVVVLHTRASHVDAIIERANSEHPDEVPQVVAVPVTGVNPAYGEWILAETS